MPGRYRTVGVVLPYLAIAAGGALLAYYELFSQFAFYDDEGYLLTSLREFTAGNALYDQVYSQYGPLYYELFGAAFKLTGLDAINDNSRLLVLLLWVVIATANGLIAERLSSSRVCGLFAQIASFALLNALAREPLHPICLTVLFTTMLLAAAAWPLRASYRRGAIALGAACGALLMVKPNVGVFAAAALLVAALLHFGGRRHARIAAILTVALPGALFFGNADLGWVQDYFFVIAGAGLTIVLRVWPREEPADGDELLPWLMRVAAAAAAVCAASIGVILVLGTTPGPLFDAIVRDPPKQAAILLVRPDLPGVAWPIAAVLAAFATRELSWLPQAGAPAALLARGAARILIAVTIVLFALRALPLTVPADQGRFALALLLAWVAVVPPAGVEEPRRLRLARLIVVLSTVFGTMQAYPVAVSQLYAATVPLAIIAAIVLADGWRLLDAWRESQPERDRLALRRAITVGVVAAVALVALNAYFRPLREHRAKYRSGVSLAIPGADRIHVPARQAEALRTITDALKPCRSIVSIPGFNSLYGWTGKRPPTSINATSWFLLFDEERQQRVVDAVKDDPRLCVVRNQQGVDQAVALSRDRRLPDRPLVRYLATTPLEPVVTVDQGDGVQAPGVTVYRRARGAQ